MNSGRSNLRQAFLLSSGSFKSRQIISKLAYLVLLVVLFVSLLMCTGTIIERLSTICKTIIADVQSIKSFSLEERRNLLYGYDTNLGYGLVQDVMSFFPDRNILPKVKYHDFSHPIQNILPIVPGREDDRILIGIDLTESDMRESELADSASPYRELRDYSLGREARAFTTIDDVDTLTAFDLFLEGPAPSESIVRVSMISSPKHALVLGQWDIRIPAGETSVLYRLPSVLRNFSHARGRTPFILVLARGDTGIKIAGIVPIGIKVDVTGYTVIKRTNRSLVALRSDFMKQIAENKTHPWNQFAERCLNE